MSGKLPASGALTFDMLNTYAGVASGTQISLGSQLARLYAGKLAADSAVSMSDMYDRGVDFTLTLASPAGNGVATPNLLLSSYFTASQLPAGGQFFVLARYLGCWEPYTAIPYSTFTKGVAATFTYARDYRKRFNVQVIYDGANTVYGYTFYSGDSTSCLTGTVYLDDIRLIL